MHQRVAVAQEGLNLLDLPQRAGVQDQVVPGQRGLEPLGGEVDAERRPDALAGDEACELLGRDSQGRAHRGLVAMQRRGAKQVGADEAMVAVDHPRRRESSLERAAAEHEGQGLAVWLELVVDPDATELGEAAIEGRVLGEEHVEELRAKVRDQGQVQGQALGQIRGSFAHEAGPGRIRIAELGRRQLGDRRGPRRVGRVGEVESKAKVEDLREPGQLALELVEDDHARSGVSPKSARTGSARGAQPYP